MKLFAVCLAIALFAAPCANISSIILGANSDFNEISGNPVVAIGRGIEIRRRAMDQVLATAKANDPKDQLPPDAEIHVLAQLIEIQLVLQNATDAEKMAGMRKNEENFARIVNTMGKPEFERRLKATLMTADDLRLMLFQEETAQTSLTRQLGIKMTDADARKYFDDNPGAFDELEKVRIREVLLYTTSDPTTSAAPPLPAATIQAKHQQILDLYERVRFGEDFAALARQYNEDFLSKGTGEVTFRAGQMEYADLAFTMEPGQISKVITDDDAYLFFQLLEKIPAQKAEFSAVVDKLKRMLTGAEKRRLAPDYIKRLRKEADIEVLDPKLKGATAAFEAEAAENAKALAAFKAIQAAEAPNAPGAKP